jgi:uncharacterized protein
MSRVLVFGATGSLGRHVLRQAVAAKHDVAVVVRSPAKLAPEVRDQVQVHQHDLKAASAAGLKSALSGADVVINTAGFVADGQAFVELVDQVITALEVSSSGSRPVCWFLAGAALLDIDESGRRGVDLPRIGSTYWPHRANFERLSRSALDWRLLCPGPMVERPGLGLGGLRTSLDRLPVQLPAFARHLPGPLLLPVFAYYIPEMIVSYGDAASLMLANVAREGEMSRRRVGLALPVGMRGRKAHWTARPMSGRTDQ